MKTLSNYPWVSIIISAVVIFITAAVWYSLLFKAAAPVIEPNLLLGIASFISNILQVVILFAVLSAFGAKGIDADWFVAVLLLAISGLVLTLVVDIIFERADKFFIDGGIILINNFIAGLILSRKLA